MARVVCTVCKSQGRMKRKAKGSFLIELLLWMFSVVMLFVFFPLAITGLIYSLWRIVGKRKVCRSCGSEAIVPLSSPRGREIVSAAERQPTSGNSALNVGMSA